MCVVDPGTLENTARSESPVLPVQSSQLNLAVSARFQQSSCSAQVSSQPLRVQPEQFVEVPRRNERAVKVSLSELFLGGSVQAFEQLSVQRLCPHQQTVWMRSSPVQNARGIAEREDEVLQTIAFQTFGEQTTLAANGQTVEFAAVHRGECYDTAAADIGRLLLCGVKAGQKYRFFLRAVRVAQVQFGVKLAAENRLAVATLDCAAKTADGLFTFTWFFNGEMV